MTSGGAIFGSILLDIPKVDFSEAVDKLNNFDIDTSNLTKDLDNLSNNIPTFDEVRIFTEGVITTPFKLIEKGINESFGGRIQSSVSERYEAYSFAPSTFCSA